MNKIIIVTHGKFAEGIVSAAQLIVGERNNIKLFGVELGCNLELIKKDISNLLDEYSKTNDTVIIMTDIFYGTPFNIVTSLMETYSFIHVTGINLGIVLEILTRNEKLLNEDVNHIIEQGKQGIINCSDIINKL